MSEKSIKLKRTESLLCELIPEALSQLQDLRINALCVSRVDCSRGKYDAEVYVDAPFATHEEKKEIMRQLAKAQAHIKDHVLTATGWYKCPKLHFLFDDAVNKNKNLDAIFAQIAKERGDS